MRRMLFAGLALAVFGCQAQAYSIDEDQRSAALPATYAPTALFFTAPYQESADTSSTDLRLSPFQGTPYQGRAFDAVEANGSATFAASSFGQSSGTDGTFTFVYGSPDTYNTLTFMLGDDTVASLTGSDIGPTPMNGYYLVRISGIGSYDSVTFGSIDNNAFEFAAVSSVPLPASAPLFGAALMALGAIGFRLKRKGNAEALA